MLTTLMAAMIISLDIRLASRISREIIIAAINVVNIVFHDVRESCPESVPISQYAIQAKPI